MEFAAPPQSLPSEKEFRGTTGLAENTRPPRQKTPTDPAICATEVRPRILSKLI